MARQNLRDREQAKGAKRKKKQIASEPPQTHTKAVNPIKSKIRDVTRLLARADNLPAGVRIEKERALAGYKQDLEVAIREKQKSQMIAKYRMVRFFERRKATRNLKKLKSQAAEPAAGSNECERLQEAIHDAEVDLNYTIYHPLTEKYLSLFPRGKTEGSASPTGESSTESKVVSTGAVQRPPMWAVVAQCMQDGNLDALREGKLSSIYAGDEDAASVKGSKDRRSNKKEKKIPNMDSAGSTGGQREDGNESDGGFFE